MLSIFSYTYCLFIHFLWRNVFSHPLSVCELGCLCCALGILWRRKWQLTPVLLPGTSHGWRSLLGYSSWSCKELDTTEQFHFHFRNSLYIRDINPLWDMWFIKFSSILWVALLLYSHCSFAQKFPVLMKFNPSIFTFVVCAFDVISKKIIAKCSVWRRVSLMFSSKSFIVLVLMF